MKLVLVAELLLLGVFVMNLANQECEGGGEGSEAVCEAVRGADELCCHQLESPIVANREKVLADIKAYVDSLDSLVRCIETDKAAVLETAVCCELIDDKPRGSKYMTITFDYYKLMEGFNWTQNDMANLLDLRRNTMDKWLQIDKLLDG